MFKRSLLSAAAAVLLTLAAAPSHAVVTTGFTCITNNIADDCAIGEDQLQLSIYEQGDLLAFRYDNFGPEDAVIADVFFDDEAGVLGGFDSYGGSGVAFDLTPPGNQNLPGGNTVNFDADLHASALPPPPTNGVGPGDWLILYLTLSAGTSLEDVAAALEGGTLRTGVHVIAFESGGSESFVNIPEGDGGFGDPVPEAGSMILLGTGIGGLLLRRLRKS
jgi:hypothetical protein